VIACIICLAEHSEDPDLHSEADLRFSEFMLIHKIQTVHLLLSNVNKSYDINDNLTARNNFLRLLHYIPSIEEISNRLGEIHR
jgi:hypothetical protein